MSLMPADFWERAERALAAIEADPAMAQLVQAEVDEFYARHTHLHRTRFAEAFLAQIVIERLSGADSQSAPQPAETKKVA